MSEQYESGAMDPYVERALDRADDILHIYATVSTVRHPPDWLPIHVICDMLDIPQELREQVHKHVDISTAYTGVRPSLARRSSGSIGFRM